MPNYDRKCTACDWTVLDQLRPVAFVWPPCPSCGAETETLWTKTPNVIPDDIPGGMVLENLDHQPTRYYSKSDIRRRCNELGLEPRVEHVPLQGSDKSPHTTRWI